MNRPDRRDRDPFDAGDRCRSDAAEIDRIVFRELTADTWPDFESIRVSIWVPTRKPP